MDYWIDRISKIFGLICAGCFVGSFVAIVAAGAIKLLTWMF